MAMRMEQTTVNQYFQARKSSSSHPSKKRKVEVAKQVITSEKIQSLPGLNFQTKTTASRNKRVRSKGKQQSGRKPQSEASLTLSTLLKATPITLDGESTFISEPVAVSDDHSPLLRRKIKHHTPTKTRDITLSPFKEASPKLSTQETFISPDQQGDYPVNKTINDQAKMVLFSRGNAFLQAGLSPQKLKSPIKASEVLEVLSPKKENDQQVTVNQNANSTFAQRRSRLRAKFSNLLKASEPPEISDTSGDNYQNKVVARKVDDSSAKVMTPAENLSPRVRARSRFKHLVEKPVASSFQLPDHYKLLLEMFRCTDSVLYLLNQRSETCTFEKLKKSVQSMCGREFSLKHLAMMKTAYPTGFVFRQEKGLHTSSGLSSKSMSYQLTVEANFKDVLLCPSSKLTSNVLITRKLKFENLLLGIVKEHHNRFLHKLNIDLNGKEIHRWHPHFNLNDVPEVEQANLPKPPISKSFSTASDILSKNRGLLIPQVEKALEDASKKSSEVNSSKVVTNAISTTTSVSSTETSSTETSFNGKKAPIVPTIESSKSHVAPSKSLLERIREKEQRKMQLAMTRDPKIEQRLSQMARLPEMCRILNTYFIAEKKVALPIDDCVKKLTESYGTALQANKIEAHVLLIAELVPKWMSIALVRKCPYVKIKKNSDINKILKTLETRKKEEEKK